MNTICLIINCLISFGAYVMALRIIPQFGEKFIKAHLYGKDLCKADQKPIPESMGVVVACVFLVALFLFIPVPLTLQNDNNIHSKLSSFQYEDFIQLIVALLSICCMILLGFADDVLDLRWRHKLLLPTIATLPLLMVYYVNYNSTTIIMPKIIRSWFGYSLDIGVLYYIYMGMLSVFCTNAINILAGINGLEVGQAMIIAASVIAFNFIELILGHQTSTHEFSIYLMMPFLAVSLALWKYNRYPSEVFVGDTYCYFAGMTFAVVGIVGHFSKTLLLFFLPQILNFLYSIPQLFKFVPCPRHRLPKYDERNNVLHFSTTTFVETDLNIIGRLIVKVLHSMRLIACEKLSDGKVQTNNFTLINLVLLIIGPMHEKHLTEILMIIQVMSTMLAFTIRYPLATYFYDT